MSNSTRTKCNYETIDQFHGLYNLHSLKTDRNAIFVDLIKLIRKMEKYGVTYFPKFYQLLNKTAKLKPKVIKELVNELRKNFLQIYLSAKTKKNMNSSDVNVVISNAVLEAPLKVREFTLKYVSNQGTSSQLFQNKLDELIKSIEDQKNANHPAQPRVNQSQNTELTSEADQSKNTQNSENITFTSFSVIPWDYDNDNDNDNENEYDIYNPNMEKFS